MIEILFGESEAASMKAAKNTVTKISKADGPTAVWCAGRKKPPEREHSGWVEGTPEEVVCLGFLLDVGDIQKDVTSDYRSKLLYSLYNQSRWESAIGGTPDGLTR